MIRISRVKDALETGGKAFLDKVFTPLEQQHADTHADTVAQLAMLFAGKEAIFKSFGIGWDSGVQPREVEIREGKSGEPSAVLAGKFAKLASERGAAGVLLSLSYDGDYAMAVATLIAAKQP